jgi:hypothetical protein
LKLNNENSVLKQELAMHNPIHIVDGENVCKEGIVGNTTGQKQLNLDTRSGKHVCESYDKSFKQKRAS